MSNPTDINARARQTAAQEEQRINAIVDRRIRETFKNGLSSGTYSSYQWDGMKIVGGGAATTRMIARYRATAPQDVASSAEDILEFNTSIYDLGATVTTGASWHFTAPTTTWYAVSCWVPVNESSIGNLYAAGDIMYVNVYVNGSIAAPFALDALFFGAATTDADSYYILQGEQPYSLTAGDTLALKFENDTGHTRHVGQSGAGGSSYITVSYA